MVLQDVNFLIPRTCECVVLYDKKGIKFTDGIKGADQLP